MSTATQTKRRLAIKQASSARLAKYFEAKLSAELGPHNVKRLLDQDSTQVVILDVRSSEGFREAHIPGAIHIPFEELPARLKELPMSKEIITYCWDVTCLLCTKAAYVLASRGYRAKEMLGGMAAWKASGFPVEQA